MPKENIDLTGVEQVLTKTTEGRWKAGTTLSEVGGTVGMIYVEDTMAGLPAHLLIATNMAAADAEFVATYASPSIIERIHAQIKEQQEQQRQVMLKAMEPIMPALNDMLDYAAEFFAGKQYDMEHTPQDWGDELEEAKVFWTERAQELQDLRALFSPAGGARG